MDGRGAALAGRRVLEIADASGAYCGKLLADMGADVVKVEPPRRDPARPVVCEQLSRLLLDRHRYRCGLPGIEFRFQDSPELVRPPIHGMVVEPDGTLRDTLGALPGSEAVIRTSEGDLRGPDHYLTVRDPLAAPTSPAAPPPLPNALAEASTRPAAAGATR